MIFSCTNKVLDRIKKLNIKIDDKMDNQLDNWYVNQFLVQRKKYFLFTNSKTLFSFISYFGSRKEIENFSNTFSKVYKEQIVRNYGYDENQLKKIDLKVNEIKFCKTNSRSVLGSMNDFKMNAEFRILRDGNETEVINSINYYFNQMPMGAIKYKRPVETHKFELNNEIATDI